ncbi:MAG: hypothetical protein PW788_02295 [Micavibrio sp.]|nr:hypothetical protein [Micavibrio sp.]
MRLYLISLVIAIICLLPEWAAMRDWEPNTALSLLNIPATGLGYMGVFFHELGHTIANWLFGYPALPTFDFQYGGGFTHSGPRMMPLLIVVYIAFAGAAIYVARHEVWWLAGAIVALALAHAAVAFNDTHQAVILYMGHGAEILIAGFCIIRAGIGATVGGTQKGGGAERYLNMIFGLFTMGRMLMLSTGLLTNDIFRAAYAGQKGGHMLGDFDRLADMYDTSINTVATFTLVMTLLVLGVSLALALLLPQKPASRYARADI